MPPNLSRLRVGPREAVWALGFGIAYGLAAEAGHWLSFEPGHIATFWPASGLSLVVLLAAPYRLWPVLIASGATSNLISDVFLHGKPFTLSAPMTLANTFESCLGAWYLRRGSLQAISLERVPDLIRFLAVAFVAPLASAVIAATAVVMHFDVSFIVVYFVWWIADCVGILISAPLTWAWLLWRPRDFKSVDWTRILELIACFVTLTVCTVVVFFGRLEPISFPFLLIPLLHWPAIRFGTVAVSACLGLLSVVITLATQAGEGPFSALLTSPSQKAVIVQAYLAASSIPFLVLAAMWHERKVAAAELEKRIEQRTQQLAEADRRKDHFLAVLAHELRNPLSPLSHALEIWPTVRHDPQKLDEIREVMSNQVQHMTGLIDDLLDVSRIAGGKILLRKECLDLREIVQTAIQSHHNQAEEAGHTVCAHVPPTPVLVEGDRARLTQMVGNLLHNAIKYTGRSGAIQVRVERNDQQVKVSVQDNGPGIPPSDLERIFDLFTQVDQTLERSHGGLGIGLTLVKNLVELHGGQVKAFSDGLGHGSRFELSLPCSARSTGNVMTAEAANQKRQLPVRKILVVDDTQASGRMLGLLLKSLGQQVEICYDGPSALETVLTYQPSLIFLDIAMPGMSGYEVAEQLKASDQTRHITLVAMTGFGQATDRERAFAAGFDHHMVKPANIEALTQVIEETV